MRRTLYIILIFILLAASAQVIGQEGAPNRLAKELISKKNQRSNSPIPIYHLFKLQNQSPLHGRALGIVENATITTMDDRITARLMRANPELIEFDFPMMDQTIRLELFNAAPVASDFKVRTSEGKTYEAQGIHYRGIIKDDPQSIASISIYKGEVVGLISGREHGNVVIGKWSDEAGSHVIYHDQDLQILQDFSCGAMRVDGKKEKRQKTTDRSAAKCVKVYFETGYGLYQNKGNSVSNVQNYVTGLFNGVSTLYANEGLGVEISEIFVWSSPDPFSNGSSSAAMSSFMSQRPNFNGDLAHLLDYTGSSNGGLAYIDVLCSSSHNYAYSDIGLSYANFPTYSWTVNVVAHEMGHNYGSPHTHACEWGPQGNQALDNCRQTEGGCDPGPEPTSGGTIMSYCHVGSGNPGINFNNGFGPEPGDLLRSSASSAGCLTDCGSGGGGSCTLAITNVIVQDATCGQNNGRITIQISGASGAVTYDIGHGAQSSNVFNDLTPGSYTVTVINGAGCERQDAATVGGSSTAPTLEAVVMNATCGQDDGQVELSANGGSSPYSYRIGTKTQSSPIFSDLEAGDYTAVVTDDNGCSANKQLTVFTQDAAAIETDVTHTTCGENNGAIVISSSGGQAPFTYKLGAQTSSSGSFTDLAPGDYSAEIVDQNGCSDAQNVTVAASEAMEANLTIEGTTCGQTDGSISVSASGGAGTLRFSIGEGFGSDPDFVGLDAGAYIVQVQDADQCVLSMDAAVNASQAFSLKSTVSSTSCGLNNAAIALNIEGSSGPYIFRLDDKEQETPLFDQVAPGIYEVAATDADGCSQEETIEVAASIPIEVQADINHTRCAMDNGEVNLSVSYAVGGLTIASKNVVQSEPNFSGLAPGTYMFMVQDSLACRDSIVVQIDSSIELSMLPEVSDTKCGAENGSVVFKDVQGASPIIYNLSSIEDKEFAVVGSDSLFKDLPPGYHHVFAEDADDCVFRDTIEIAPSPGIMVQKEVDHTTCNLANGKIAIEATGGTGELTIRIDTTQDEDLIFEGLTANVYLLTVRDEADCIHRDTVEVNASTTPQVDPRIKHTTCGLNNGNAQLLVTGGIAPYHIYLNSEEESEFVNNLHPGNYQIRVVDSSDCVDTTSFMINPSTSPDLAYDIKAASCYQNNGSVSVSGSNGTLPYQFTLDMQNSINDTFSALDSGNYVLQIIDSVGCSDTALVTVAYDDQYQKPELPPLASICNGDPAILDAGLQDIVRGGQWFRDGIPSADTIATISVMEAGTYIFSIDYHDNCQLSDTTFVVVRQKPILNLTAKDTICRDSPFVPGQIDDAFTYQWSNDSIGPTVAFEQSDNYELTVTNEYGCSTKDTVNIEVVQPVVLTSSAEAYFICEGSTLTLLVEGAETYAWSADDPTFVPTPSSSLLVSPSIKTNYRVLGSNSCFEDTLDLSVSIRSREDVVTSDTVVIEGSPLALQVEGASAGIWNSPFDASCIECIETIIRPEQAGEVYVSYDDRHGCSWRDTVQIEVIPLADIFPRLINVITPNYDGKNDLLVFEGLDQFKSSKLQVFDQQGMPLYQNEAYDNAWDGQFEGSMLPEGVYFYMLTLELDDRIFHFDSDLTLIRD
ncbi:MAG: T9SS type B sorting domain-containing protein [Saprospiraceae bacterium]|nr:T9SS type B sorting domain-containing protein [Saprospiraceae bacterium]